MKLTAKCAKSVQLMLDQYSQYHPSVLSLRQFLEFGSKNACEKTSYTFLRKELPVRLANIMKEIHLLPEHLVQQPSVRVVEGWYERSFQEILKFETQNATDPNVLRDFCETLIRIRNRHSHVVETMAHGVMEMKDSPVEDAMAADNQVHYFLDRFYMSRISIRMLINQHTLLFGNTLNNSVSRHVGAIDPSCDVLLVAKDAFDNARFLCEQYYLTAPDVDFVCINPYEDSEAIQMAYVPSHMYHILFELFKNAMRAVVEFHDDQDELPRIQCMICKGKEDLSIKIGDQGGGISRSNLDMLFNYMYSTAPQPSSPQAASAAPLAGYGYGLPLSRLYAKYFNGDLVVNSIEGYGTDALVYMKVLTSDAAELLPIYNKTSESQYKSSVPVGDWSDPTQTTGLHGAVHQVNQNRLFHSQRRYLLQTCHRIRRTQLFPVSRIPSKPSAVAL